MYLVRFQALMGASMKIRAFWGIAPCSLGVEQCFIPLMMEQYASLKRRSTLTRLHRAIAQKALISIPCTCS
jgi:hypothetical protein